MHVSEENTNSKSKSLLKSGDIASSENNNGNTLTSVINKLKQKHDIEEYTKKVIDEDLSEVKEEDSKMLKVNEDLNKAHDLLVEQIGNNNVAVFQTLVNSVSKKDNSKEDNMKTQVSVLFYFMYRIVMITFD